MMEADWLEFDYNPFILFDMHGRVKSLNNEAQYLLGDVSSKEIFNIATSYASHSYGFKTTMVDLDFSTKKFYGITVGYHNEDAIGIKLYKKPHKQFTNISTDGEMVNLYSLLDLCISAEATSSQTIYIKEFDPAFPDIILNIEEFVKVLSYVIKQVSRQEKTTIKLSLITGEYLKVGNKKYQIFIIAFSCEDSALHIDQNIEELATKINCTLSKKGDTIMIKSPMVY